MYAIKWTCLTYGANYELRCDVFLLRHNFKLAYYYNYNDYNDCIDYNDYYAYYDYYGFIITT